MPSGSMYQQAAAWELVVTSIILAGMILWRCVKGNKFHSDGWTRNVMVENSKSHTFLYFILFALVFSAMLSFFLG
jgi:hypothetical protein